MDENKYTIGIDFGTDSVRALVVDATDGSELGSGAAGYSRWEAGKYCDPEKNQFRQHPLDYVESLERSIKEALEKSPAGVAGRVAAISIDTTGSTPVAVNREGVPLAMLEGFEENPNAMFMLWKDHSAIQEAEEINELSRSWGGVDYTRYEGGIYSSEWFWAKMLHALRHDREVRGAAYSWVEHCDWMPALMTGETNPLNIRRSRCAAGHKAMWHPEWGGLPSEAFLARLDPSLAGLRDRLYQDTFTADVKAGTISGEWAKRLGVPGQTAIGVGALDAHLGAVGGEIKPHYLSKVMGTSTCDMMVVPEEEMNGKLVPGICGQVSGSVLPEMVGLEAGQSAFGDIFAWFKDILMWPAENLLLKSDWLDEPSRQRLLREMNEQAIQELSRAAAGIPIDESGIVALDWLNGRRTPDADQNLKGGLTGLSLGSTAPKIFRALVEAAAFGSKKIVDRFSAEGIRIDGVIAMGGVAKKSAFVMQTVADVLNVPIMVAGPEQASALGAAMAAAVVAGIHPSFQEAQKAMGKGFERTYSPIPEHAEKYKSLYARYSSFGSFVEAQTLTDKRREKVFK